MPGPFSREVIALALAFTFAFAVFALALAFRVPRRWRYMIGATGTWAIGLIMAEPLAIGTYCSPSGFGPLLRRAQAARIAQASTIVAVEQSLLVTLLTALTKCKE